MSVMNRPPEDVVLASPVQGMITLHNKPAAGARVIRKVSIGDDGEPVIDETTTDDKGHFGLPILRKEIVLGKLTQYAVFQDISVVYAGEKYEIWHMGSGSKTEYGELGGKPINFRCELSDPDQPMTVELNLLMTKCKWDAIEPIEGN